MKPFHCNECERAFRTEDARRQHTRDAHGINTPKADEAAPLCIECKREAHLVYGEAIYPHRPDLYFKRSWLCECGAYCGCHGVTTRPLGNPCGKETRIARMAAHAAFDPLWKGRTMGRRDAYTWLAARMSLPSEQCHIGMMTEPQAREVVFHCHARATASETGTGTAKTAQPVEGRSPARTARRATPKTPHSHAEAKQPALSTGPTPSGNYPEIPDSSPTPSGVGPTASTGAE